MTSPPPASGIDRLAFHLLKVITRTCDALGVLLLAGVLVLIVAAIVVRDIIGLSMPWTEEVATFLAIYAVGFGSLSAWVRGEHLLVDLFSHRLGALARHIQYRLVALLSAGFFGLAAYGSLTMSVASAHNRTVSLGISFTYLYYGIFIGFAGMTLLATWQALRGPVEWNSVAGSSQEAD